MKEFIERGVDKVAQNSIIMSGQINDVLFGLKEISCKLDTIIALLQVGVSHQQQPQGQLFRKE